MSVFFLIKSWIYENHICELRSEELNEGWSWQLYTQLLQLRKESLKQKNSGRYGIRTLDLCDTKPEFFSGFLVPIIKVVYVTAMIIVHLSVFCCCCRCCCCCLVLFRYETVTCWGFTLWKNASRTVKLLTETLIQCPTKHMVKAN